MVRIFAPGGEYKTIMIQDGLTCGDVVAILKMKFGYSKVDTVGFGLHIVHESKGKGLFKG